jgi:hypothetical protein
LGTVAGANTVTATAAGLTGSPVTFTATGSAGAISQLVITTQPNGATTGVPFTAQPVLELRDVNDNVVTTASTTVTVTVESGPGALLGTAAVDAAAGIATFTDLRLDEPGAYTLRFSTTDPALSVVSATFTVVVPDRAVVSDSVAPRARREAGP